jgi:hypothetical protein
LDPSEEHAQSHGGVHNADAHPDAEFGIAFGDAQEGEGKGCLAQDGRENGEGGRNVAEQADQGEIRRLDVPHMLAQAQRNIHADTAYRYE